MSDLERRARAELERHDPDSVSLLCAAEIESRPIRWLWRYWLARGKFHVLAANRAGVQWLPAEVKRGTKRDAILYSVGANSAHGLPRTNADKRRAVTMLLEDEEWAAWSDREIARRCAVSHTTVIRIREELSLEQCSSEPATKSYTTKHGTVATMNTENIGRGHSGAKAEKTEAIRELAKGQPLSDADDDRLLQAVQRIDHAAHVLVEVRR